MSCLDLCDQFYSLPDPHKTINKTRTPPPVHIESLDKLESETAALPALSVSDEVVRPRKSSLATSREEATPRSPKSVRFSDCVQVRSVPARRRDLFSGTGMDLVNIIKAANDEFASLIGKRAQPDSPAPWQASSKARWDLDRRAPALSCNAVPSKMATRALQSKRKPSVKRSLHLLRASTMASRTACGTGHGRARNVDAFNAVRPWRGDTTPIPRPGRDRDMALGPRASSVRTRLALLRYMRRVRQRIASQRHSTALLKRRCQGRVQSQGHPTKSPQHGLGLLAPVIPQQQSAHNNRNQTTASSQITPVQQNVLAFKHSAQRVRTYVDHIRDQRSPPKAVPLRFVSGRSCTPQSVMYN